MATTYLIGINDNDRIVAGDPEDFVRQYHARSLSPSATDAEFMRDVAERVKMLTGARVRTARAGDFLDDLIRSGMVKVGASK